MSNVWFMSDQHIGHKSINRFSPSRGGHDVESHIEWLIEQHNSVVRKQDLVWMPGDVCFDRNYLECLKRMNGVKHLVMGNHDTFGVADYLPYFNKVSGLVKRYGFWISHAPIHPRHLRGKLNIHGHSHNRVVKKRVLGFDIRDNRYINVCVEQNDGVPFALEDIRDKYHRSK